MPYAPAIVTASSSLRFRHVTVEEQQAHAAANSLEGGFITFEVNNDRVRRETITLITRKIKRALARKPSTHRLSIDVLPSAWELLIPGPAPLPLGWTRRWTSAGREVIEIKNSYPLLSWLFGASWYHIKCDNGDLKVLDWKQGVRLSFHPEGSVLTIIFKNSLFSANGIRYPQ